VQGWIDDERAFDGLVLSCEGEVVAWFHPREGARGPGLRLAVPKLRVCWWGCIVLLLACEFTANAARVLLTKSDFAPLAGSVLLSGMIIGSCWDNLHHDPGFIFQITCVWFSAAQRS
jgi:hypothetical protein